MEEIRFKRQQLLSSKKKTAMYKRNMTMFTSMKKKFSEAYIIFVRNVPEYKLKLNLLEQVLGEVDKEVFEENEVSVEHGTTELKKMKCNEFSCSLFCHGNFHIPVLANIFTSFTKE